jgi:hypothetical protein
VAALLNAGIQVLFLKRELGGIEGRLLAASLARVAVIGAATAATGWAAERLLSTAISGEALAVQVLRLGASLAVALVAFAASAALLRAPEFGEATAALRQRVRGSSGE